MKGIDRPGRRQQPPQGLDPTPEQDDPSKSVRGEDSPISPPQSRSRAGFVVSTARTYQRCRIDDAALVRWCEDKGDDLDCEVPDWVVEDAGAALSRMFYDARQAGVVIGDPDLQLDVDGHDDADGPGWYVLLRSRYAQPSGIWLTSGWCELEPVPDTVGPEPSDAARFYLDEICTRANRVLDAMIVV